VFSTADTIVAIATPPGRGGIGVVRVSGPAARQVARCLIVHAQDLEPRHATLTLIRRAAESMQGEACGVPARDRNRSSALTGAVSHTESPGEARGSALPRTAASASPQQARLAEAGALPGDPSGATDAIDQVVATYFPAPASYTGEDVVELSAHGSPVVLRAILEGAMDAGARLAEPGEFTLRAFLNGRINLVQAEAVRDLIEAVTPLQARAAFDQLQGTLTQAIGEIDSSLFDLIARLEASIDFPDEGYHFVASGALAVALGDLIDRTERLIAAGRRGRIVREGAQVAIVGKPNVGKSSVFNALVGSARAIVTDVPGTTRDLLTETVDLDGIRVTFVDTAGLRQTTDRVEAEGVARARQAGAVSDLVLVVLDGSSPLDESDREILSHAVDEKSLTVRNKADLETMWSDARAVSVSATTLEGIPELRGTIVRALDVEAATDRPDITNIRHIDLARRAREAMVRARDAAEGLELSEEFVLADLQDAKAAFEEISGRRTSEDLLRKIFSQFCIGK
jgi:tRNA modification GTPase